MQKKIWLEADKILRKLRIEQNLIDPMYLALGAFPDSSITSMTIIAETLIRITRIRDSDNFLRSPAALVKDIIKYLLRTEWNNSIKEHLRILGVD